VKHIFCRLFEVVIARELRKRNLFRKKINFQDITFMKGVLEVALPASIMLKGRSNVPSNLSMLTKGRTGIC
jgi:hypothetical protein